MKAATTIVTVVAALALAGAAAIAVQNHGAGNIQLDGGKKGAVGFPHHLHQDTISDCNACHAVFSMEHGVIKKLKEQKKLEPKQVMNNTCLKCHRAGKNAGGKTGPIRCSRCHAG